LLLIHFQFTSQKAGSEFKGRKGRRFFGIMDDWKLEDWLISGLARLTG
jgi:hypothetical protein